jgi:predicted NAD/FAD-binding protein
VQYVRKVLARLKDVRLATPVTHVTRQAQGVTVHTAHGPETFDGVVLACHSDQALRLLGAQATANERDLLGAIRYQPNRAVLHTDAPAAAKAVRPGRPGTTSVPQVDTEQSQVCLHYLINALQPLPWQQPVVVSLNPVREPDPATVIQEIAYDHPVFDQAAIDAQARLPAIQGTQGVWFAGAWCGYGFHEDGFQAGLRAAKLIRQQTAWAARAAA